MPKRKRGFYSVGEIDSSPQLATELLSYGNECVDIDQQIQILREQKADLFERMRDSSFDPAHAKAWSAEKLKDEEKEALKREKRTEAELIVETLAATETAKGRAGARARNAAKAASQEKIDPTTGEVLGDAPAPTPDSLGPLRHQEEQPSPSEPRSLTDRAPEDTSRSACANPAAAQVVTGQSGMTATRQPLRTLPPRVPEPAPEMPDLPAFLDRRNERAEAAAE